MLSEHTVILAKEKINEEIDKGCLGVIVYVYGNDALLTAIKSAEISATKVQRKWQSKCMIFGN